ncbi:hypothetical protein N7467_003073 [Penicillium canescens]|nr:hypothetical protein N7467_003073 [Penicillium canescens]
MARRAHLKSRLGCRVCKQRKVKCDERKPVCDRCVTAGRRTKGLTREAGGGESIGEKRSRKGQARILVYSYSLPDQARFLFVE